VIQVCHGDGNPFAQCITRQAHLPSQARQERRRQRKILATTREAREESMADRAGPRSLDEAKQWLRSTLERRVHPMGLTDPAATLAVIDGLAGLDGQNWASAWMGQGDRFRAKAEAAEAGGDTAGARDAWYQAYGFYFLGRFPCPNHPAKEDSYKREREAYLRFGALLNPAIDLIRLPFVGREGEGTELTLYLRRPEGVERPPVVLLWGGVDAWKEEMTILTADLVAAGFATLAMDNVGTGESPIKAGPDGERQFLPVLDWIETCGRFDATRLALVGRSFGGHWATKLAHLFPARFRAVVNWGGGVHYMFQPDWIEASRHPDSYLMELVETRSRMLGARNDAEYINGFKRLSLLDQGLLDQPSAPLLLINGRNDTQCPIADIDLLCDHGSPKSVRLFAGRGHMGFGPGTVPAIIDWLAKRLA
jgi:esterase FrsA